MQNISGKFQLFDAVHSPKLSQNKTHFSFTPPITVFSWMNYKHAQNTIFHTRVSPVRTTPPTQTHAQPAGENKLNLHANICLTVAASTCIQFPVQSASNVTRIHQEQKKKRKEMHFHFSTAQFFIFGRPFLERNLRPALAEITA